MPSSFSGTRLRGIMGPRVFNVRHLGLVLMSVVTKIPCRQVSYNADGSGHWPIQEKQPKGATSRFTYLEKFSPNFSSSSFAIRINLLHP